MGRERYGWPGAVKGVLCAFPSPVSPSISYVIFTYPVHHHHHHRRSSTIQGRGTRQVSGNISISQVSQSNKPIFALFYLNCPTEIDQGIIQGSFNRQLDYKYPQHIERTMLIIICILFLVFSTQHQGDYQYQNMLTILNITWAMKKREIVSLKYERIISKLPAAYTIDLVSIISCYQQNDIVVTTHRWT